MAKRRLVRRATVLPAVLALLATGGGLAWATAGSAATGYRTANVTVGDVEQLLTATGTTRNVDQTQVSFPASGTVATVAAQVGAAVRKGQTLATLDPAPLQDAVVAATATLDKAKATLETDSASTSSTAAASTAPASSGTTAARTTTATTSGSATRTSASGAKNAGSGGATSAVSDSTALLAVAQRALQAATVACASTGSSTGPTEMPTSTPSPTPSLTTSPSDTATPTTSPSLSSATRSTGGASSPAGAATPTSGTDCATMLQAALGAQQKVAQSQTTTERALQSAATGSAAASAAPATSSPAGGTTSTATQASSGTQGGAGQGAAAGQSQAARVTTDQAAVAAAQVALDVANKNLAGARLTSPVDGRIASQPFTVGSSSGTSSIIIVAPGAVQITVNVPATSVALMKVGQVATVTPDGSTTASSGTVTAIGLLPTTSSGGSTTTYPVQVLVAKPGPAFVEGAAASVAITVKTLHAVLTVPNSALSDGAVMVLTKGKAVQTRVQTGAVGALMTEVTSGLKAGQQVVLADLGAALPANSTTTPRGLGGTGGPQGGFTGGPPVGVQGVRPGG